MDELKINEESTRAGRPRRLGSNAVTHEIRMLRAQAASMEDELQALQSKWRDQLQDGRILATAQESAREKHATSQAEKVREDLLQSLQQQQLLFATLQTAVDHSPFDSSGKEMFEALHFGTRLGSDPAEREKLLLEHHKRSITTLPSIVDIFLQKAIHRHQESEESDNLLKTPLSRLDVTGCEDSTLVSSVFISEIPCASLEQVYSAVLAYFDDVPSYMKRHFNVHAERTRLNSANSPVLYRRSTFEGSKMSATVNNIMCSELTASYGMVHVDAVTDDPLHPVIESASSQYSVCGLTITPLKEPLTGQTLSVMLRWLVVYRYNMLPYDPRIKENLQVIRPILNGDLITASVCSYIQERQMCFEDGVDICQK